MPDLDVRDDTGEDFDTSDITALARFLLDRLGMAADAELSITLVDEPAMAALHVEWMDEPGPTDVLSFPMDELREPAPGQPRVSGVLGDVVVCPAVARRQAVVAGHDETHEIRVLVTHGVLHLLGNDHADPVEEQVMFDRQRELVAEYAESRR
ncbi:MAG: rRNA maturation RNase YbeY [Candidatus Nanopelagicales bacterium]